MRLKTPVTLVPFHYNQAINHCMLMNKVLIEKGYVQPGIPNISEKIFWIPTDENREKLSGMSRG